MSLPRYPKYKDSGVEWLGEVPEHWKITQVKRLLKPDGYKAGPFGSALITSNLADVGTVLVMTPEHISKRSFDLEFNQYLPDDRVEELDHFRVNVGDVVLPIVGTLGRAIVIDEPLDAILNQRLARISPDSNCLSPRFLALMLTEFDYFKRLDEVEGKGAILSHITKEILINRRLAAPPVIEQREILAFLDKELGKIDALVEEQQRLIELLKEKRQVVISHAVTKGLNPAAPLKDSGADWMGKVPRHWRVETGRHMFEERDERSDSGEEEMLTVSHLTGVTPRSEKTVNMFEAETNEGYKKCSAGELVINTLWAWMGAMGIAQQSGIVSPAYNVYVPKAGFASAYIDKLVRIQNFADEASRWSKGVWSSRLRLYPQEFFRIDFPVPPLEEQGLIAKHVDAEILKCDLLAGQAQAAIDLLEERRAALISAAVTGKIDVRGLSGMEAA